MTRPRQFNEETVIAQAREAFWADGMTATSISGLSKATGLSTGSLYKAFGSKEQLHDKTLEQYVDMAVQHATEVLTSASSPMTGIETLFDALAEMYSSDVNPRGCYGVACAAELPALGSGTRPALQRFDREMLALFEKTLRAATQSGELNSGATAKQIRTAARMTIIATKGLSVESRVGVTTEDARQILENSLTPLR